MTALLVALLAAFRSSVRSRLELETEILALRHQLAVLQRQTPRRPRLGRVDRVLWVLLSRLWPNWRRAVQIVTPDTVVRWHRLGFARYWRRRSRPRRAGRPAVAVAVRELIRHMHAVNPLYVKPGLMALLTSKWVEVQVGATRCDLGRNRLIHGFFWDLPEQYFLASVDGRLRRPRSGWGACSAAAKSRRKVFNLWLLLDDRWAGEHRASLSRFADFDPL